MKKRLLVLSIITTAVTVFFTIYAAVFFSMYVKAKTTGQGDSAVTFSFFLIFDFVALCCSIVNFVPNTIHFAKTKKVVVIVLFVIALVMLLFTAGTFLYFYISQFIKK